MAWYTVDGEPLKVGELTVTTRTRVLSARFGQREAFAWQMPDSVLVDNGGTSQRMRIVNVTLLVQTALMLLVFLFRRVS